MFDFSSILKSIGKSSEHEGLKTQLAEIDSLISTYSQNLDALVAFRERIVRGDQSVSLQQFLDKDLFSESRDDNLISSLKTITTNSTLVDCRIFFQVVSTRGSKVPSPEDYIQLISAIDVNGSMSLYSDTGSLLWNSTLPMWTDLGAISYDGNSANLPLFLLSYKNGTTLGFSFDIRREKMSLAGQKVASANKQATRSKSAGFLSFLMNTRTVVNRGQGASYSAKSRRLSKLNGTSTSRDPSSRIASIPPIELTMRPLFELTSKTDGTFKLKKYHTNGSLLPGSSSDEDAVVCADSSTCPNTSTQQPYVTAILPFYDINKKHHKIFLGDSTGTLFYLDKVGKMIDSHRLSTDGKRINHITRSTNTLAVATDDTIFLVYIMGFKKIEYTCTLDINENAAVITHLAFDARIVNHLYVSLSNGQIFTFNIRAQDPENSKNLFCGILDVFDSNSLSASASAPEQLSIEASKLSSNVDAKAKSQMVAWTSSKEMSRNHALLTKDIFGKVGIVKGYMMFASKCSLHFFNTSLSDKEETDILHLGSKSWCGDLKRHEIIANASNSEIFSKIFVDTTPHTRKLVNAIGSSPMTVVAYNSPVQGNSFQQQSQIQIYINHVAAIERIEDVKWPSLVQGPWIFLIVGVFLFLNLFKSTRQAKDKAKDFLGSQGGNARGRGNGRFSDKRPAGKSTIGRRITDVSSDSGRSNDEDDSDNNSYDDPAFQQLLSRVTNKSSGGARQRGLDPDAEEFLDRLSAMKDLSPEDSANITKALQDMQSKN